MGFNEIKEIAIHVPLRANMQSNELPPGNYTGHVQEDGRVIVKHNGRTYTIVRRDPQGIQHIARF